MGAVVAELSTRPSNDPGDASACAEGSCGAMRMGSAAGGGPSSGAEGAAPRTGP